MATIYNSELTKELTEGAKIQTNRDNIPNQIAEKVVPVMEVNPKLLRTSKVLGIYSTASTKSSQIIYTNPSGKDTYITALWINNLQTAASDNVVLYITATFDGAAYKLITLNKPTLSAINVNQYLQFVPPLKIDKDGTLRLTCAFTVGASTTDISIFGYNVDNANA